MALKERLEKVQSLMENSLTSQAKIEIRDALYEDYNVTMEFLNRLFRFFYKKGEYELAITAGELIIRFDRRNEFLVNLMGNCHRQLGQLKEANNFYRLALRFNKNSIAFFNLAASLARAGLYDKKAVAAAKRGRDYQEFIYPHLSIRNKRELERTVLSLAKHSDLIEQRNLEQERVLEKEAELVDLDGTNAEPTAPTPAKDGSAVETDLFEDATSDEDEDAEAVTPQILINFDWEELPEHLRHHFEWYVFNKAVDLVRGKETLLTVQIFNKSNVQMVRDLRDAREMLLKLKDFKSHIIYTNMLLGLALYMEGRKDEAIVSIKEGMPLDMDNRFFHVNLGVLYRKLGNRLMSTAHLIKGAMILEELGGTYQIRELIEKGEEYLNLNLYEDALKYYLLISKEVNSETILSRIGVIHTRLGDNLKAAYAYKEVMQLNPANLQIQRRIEQLFYKITEEAEDLAAERRYPKSMQLFEEAITIHETPEVLKRMSGLFGAMGNVKRQFELKARHDELIEITKQKQLKIQKESLIKEAIRGMKIKDFNMAIRNLEESFSLKPCKESFMFLSHIYKNLKRKQALTKLINRWNYYKRVYESEEEGQEQQEG